MSALPKSVQDQAAAAASHFEAPVNPEPSAPESAPEATDAPQEAQSATPEQQPADAKRSEAYWEHRFRVIEGKYSAEVPALRNEIKDLQVELKAKTDEIQSLQSKPAESTGHPDLSDEQLEAFKDEYGEDFVSFVQRMVAGKSAPDSHVKDLEQRVQRFEQRDQVTSESLFWAALQELVPDYQAVNQDTGFHTFLSEIDPQTGRQRQHTLSAAQTSLDAQTVADLFLAYKSQAPKRQAIPDDQVDPKTTRASDANPGQPGGKIWSGPEISQFYRDKTAGRIKSDDAQRLEADIFAAQREGRVR